MKQIKTIIPLLFVIFFTFGSAAYSQPRPPSDHGEDGDQSAQQQAPIGSGLTLLVTLGAVYGAGKMYQNRKK